VSSVAVASINDKCFINSCYNGAKCGLPQTKFEMNYKGNK